MQVEAKGGEKGAEEAGEGRGKGAGREKGREEEKEGEGGREEEKKRLLSSFCHDLDLAPKSDYQKFKNNSKNFKNKFLKFSSNF